MALYVLDFGIGNVGAVRTGRVVPIGSRALAEALADEIADIGSDRGLQARARIVDDFSTEIMVDRTLTLLMKADDHHST